MLSAFASNKFALDTELDSGRNRAKVFDLQVPGHGCKPASADCVAHRLVKQCGNDAPMQIARMAFKAIRNRWQADDRPIGSEQKLEKQPSGVLTPTSKTAVMGCVLHRGKIFSRPRQDFSIPAGVAVNTAPKLSISTLPPLNTIPTRLSLICFFSLSAAAIPAAPAPSARLCVSS